MNLALFIPSCPQSHTITSTNLTSVKKSFSFISVEFLKSQWKTLRDNFKRCMVNRIKQQKSKGKDPKKKLSTCKFYEKLTFLIPIVTKQPDGSKLINKQDIDGQRKSGIEPQMTNNPSSSIQADIDNCTENFNERENNTFKPNCTFSDNEADVNTSDAVDLPSSGIDFTATSGKDDAEVVDRSAEESDEENVRSKMENKPFKSPHEGSNISTLKLTGETSTCQSITDSTNDTSTNSVEVVKGSTNRKRKLDEENDQITPTEHAKKILDYMGNEPTNRERKNSFLNHVGEKLDSYTRKQKAVAEMLIQKVLTKVEFMDENDLNKAMDS